MLDALYTLVGSALRVIHSGFARYVDPDSAVAWAGSIVVLVILLRLALLPLAVKQARSMQKMQLVSRELQPQMKVLQERHKGDRATLQAEQLKLFAETGKNPMHGAGGAFLPILIQAPIFFGVFKVLQAFQPGAAARYGLSAELLEAGANARILGAPIAAALTSSADKIQSLGGSLAGTRIVAIVLLLVMGATTYLSQWLVMRRARGLEQTAQQLQIQKVLLVVIPLSLVVFGVAFPLGVLLYWFTSNLWTLGQQTWIHRLLGPLPAAATSSSIVGSQQVGTGPVLQPKTKQSPAKASSKPAAAKPPASRSAPGAPAVTKPAADGRSTPSRAPQGAQAKQSAQAKQASSGKRAAGTRKNKRKRR